MNNQSTVSFFKTAYPWLMCLTGMLFYCFNYFLRVSPGVMQTELTQAFHISAYQFGALAAFYYYAYTPMQIPAGLIYDKFGVRVVLAAACLVATFGLWFFVNATSYYTAAAGRFMIGLGVAFAYIGSLKLASIWLAPNRFATIAGLTTAMGMASGAFAQKYLTKFVQISGYQQALHTVLYAGIFLSFLFLFVLRNAPKHAHHEGVHLMKTPINLNQLTYSLKIVLLNPQMWLIGIIGCLSYLPASVFLDLWGIPYLKAVYNLTPEQASTISAITFIGWIISGPIIGAYSDRVKCRKMPIIITSFFATLLLAIVFYFPIPNGLLIPLFFSIGFCCGAHPLCFALGKENNPIQISGTSVAVTNMFIMLGGVICQPLVGRLLDWHAGVTPKLVSTGVTDLPLYSASDYTFALSIVPIGVCLSLLLSVFLKETHCQSQAKAEHEEIFSNAAHVNPSLATSSPLTETSP